MGQYHAPACLETGEAIYSHPLGDGLKLMEFGCSGSGGVLTALALLLGPKGSWAGKRIAIVGDYAEVGDIPAGLPFADDPAQLYSAMRRDDVPHDASLRETAPFTAGVRDMISEAFGVTYSGKSGWLDRSTSVEPNTNDDQHFGPLFVVNIDKGQYLDPWAFGEGRNLPSIALGACGTMLGLTILLSVSNGRGGGGFHGDSPLVGSWGCDRIAITPAAGGTDRDISADVRRALIEGGEGDWMRQPISAAGETPGPSPAEIEEAEREANPGKGSLRPDFLIG